MKKIFMALIALFAVTAMAAPLKIKLYTGFPPGGPDDIVARILQREIQARDPNATVIVEPLVGGGGLVALNKLATSERGDYIELMLSGSNLVGATYITKANTVVDLEKDVKIVAPIAYTNMVLLASKHANVTTVADIKKASLTSKPRIGSAGNGSLSHLTASHFFSQVTPDGIINASYKGTQATYPDLLAGRIDYIFDFTMAAKPKVGADLVVPIAIAGTTRSKLLPQVPTMSEVGLNTFAITPWWAIYANKHLTDDEYKLLHGMLVDIMSSPEMVKQFDEFGAIIWSKSDMSNPTQWFNKQKEIFKREAVKFENESRVNK